MGLPQRVVQQRNLQAQTRQVAVGLAAGDLQSEVERLRPAAQIHTGRHRQVALVEFARTVGHLDQALVVANLDIEVLQRDVRLELLVAEVKPHLRHGQQHRDLWRRLLVVVVPCIGGQKRFTAACRLDFRGRRWAVFAPSQVVNGHPPVSQTNHRQLQFLDAHFGQLVGPDQVQQSTVAFQSLQPHQRLVAEPSPRADLQSLD